MEEEEAELSPVAEASAGGKTLEQDERYVHKLNYMEAKRAVDEATKKMTDLGPHPPLHRPGMAGGSSSAAGSGSSSKIPASFVGAKPKAKRLKTKEEDHDEPYTDYKYPCNWENLGADPAGFTWEMCESFVIDFTDSKAETKKWCQDKLEPIGLQYLFCYLFVRLLCVCVSVFMCCILQSYLFGKQCKVAPHPVLAWQILEGRGVQWPCSVASRAKQGWHPPYCYLAFR
jgi:hypothetical protein